MQTQKIAKIGKSILIKELFNQCEDGKDRI